MPRSTQEILDHADALARRFEHHQPDDRQRDATALRAIRKAVVARGNAERHLVATVITARNAGHSWAAIGTMLGTSGEAARQRYAQLLPTP